MICHRMCYDMLWYALRCHNARLCYDMLGYDWLCFDMRLQDMHITWAQLYKKTYIYIFLSCGTPGMSSPKTPSDGPTEMLCTMPCDDGML